MAGLGEVSLGQKMMSAVSGSILTSLLGMCIPVHIRERIKTTDVVRVNLSQFNTVASPLGQEY